jgi:hypothetical protein
MNHLRRILAAVTLAGAGLALATAPAAFARPLPPPDCCVSGRAAGAPVTFITGGGMPGWQITLIAVGAALAGAALAILLERTWVTRKTHAATA